jgi:hypothetical protein
MTLRTMSKVLRIRVFDFRTKDRKFGTILNALFIRLILS